MSVSWKQKYFQGESSYSYSHWKTYGNGFHFQQLKTKEKLLFLNEVFWENLRRINNEDFMVFVPTHFFLSFLESTKKWLPSGMVLPHGSTVGTLPAPLWNEVQLSPCFGFTSHFGNYVFAVIPTKIPDQAGRPVIAD